MDTEIQTIMTPNGEELVVLSRSDYEALLSAAEDADDHAVIDARSDEPTLPHDDAMAIIRGELHPVAAWREARGLRLLERAHPRRADRDLRPGSLVLQLALEAGHGGRRGTDERPARRGR